ncbi:unnamed protein product [Medioppia subpectinata]|uniref:Uncharacterized protein n=1 Tax=Medioppia subpectinata TaxID=1979941 RepID=A0A7R9PTI3_9ACAR|nr:unnamed protein product [Medioppia subpectinata]CAG2100669.1 unnamed protein product [Medioppia subpectinata]
MVIKELVILSSLLVIIIKCEPNYERIDCNSATFLYPCRCLNDPRNEAKVETINCTGGPLELKQISQELNDRLLGDRKYPKSYKIQKLVIQNTPIQQIRSKVFERIPFVEIIIKDNHELHYIDRNAFNGSADSLEVINLIDNRKLAEASHTAADLWILLSKFVKLREIKVTGNGITSIPSHAFRSVDGQRDRLKHIDLSHNQIHTIGDFAFEALTSPSLDLIFSHNKIRTIGKNVFRFQESREVIRMIDLSHNQLYSQSFDVESFSRMGRPLAILSLKDNKMDALSEKTFGPLFDRSDKNYFVLEVVGNNIHCDCPLGWTVRTKYCYTDKSVPVSHQIVSLKCGPKSISQYDFSYCSQMEERLSPSCRTSGHNTAIPLLQTNHKLFAFTIMSALIMFSF